MKKSYIWLAIGFVFLSIATLILLQMFCSDFYPYELRYESPTGEYCLEQRYTDIGAVGYRGRTFLTYGNQHWYVDSVGPGYVGWLSNTEFYIGQRFSAFYEEHSVFEYISATE